MIKRIDSAANKTFKELQKLVKNRDRGPLVLIEGEDLVKEAYSSLHLVALIFYDEELVSPADIDTIILSRELYRELASYQSLPRVMGIAKLSLTDPLFGNLVYLDGVQDPGNVGTIIRTALALGYGGVVLSPDSASPLSSKVVQASKGAIFKIPVAVKKFGDLPDLSRFTIIGTSLDGEKLGPDYQPPKDFILVMGSEGRGMSKEVAVRCDRLFLLPISSIDSLNVSVAAGIFMYVLRRPYGRE